MIRAGHGTGDLADVTFDTYLTNKKTLSDPDIQRVSAGDTVVPWFINASIASQFTLDLGQLPGKIIAADGNPVVPLMAAEIPLATGQRIDVRVIIPSKDPTSLSRRGRRDSATQTGLVLTKEEDAVPELPLTREKKQPCFLTDREVFIS
jgi:FtsP/CotA-like multicopper oxidase with cupredoxin domain